MIMIVALDGTTRACLGRLCLEEAVEGLDIDIRHDHCCSQIHLLALIDLLR